MQLTPGSLPIVFFLLLPLLSPYLVDVRIVGGHLRPAGSVQLTSQLKQHPDSGSGARGHLQDVAELAVARRADAVAQGIEGLVELHRTVSGKADGAFIIVGCAGKGRAGAGWRGRAYIDRT